MLTNIPLNYWLGFALTIWLLIDLTRGVAYIWHPYERKYEPGMYWLTMSIWAIVAASCFVLPN